MSMVSPVISGDKPLVDVEAKIDDKWNDSQADCALISSDKVAFLVPKYMLQTISPVFREALANNVSHASRTTIDLTDPSFEDSKTIRAFLDFVSGDWRLVFAKDDAHQCFSTDVPLMASLLSLVDKWDCRLVFDALTQHLSRFYASQQSLDSHLDDVLSIFILAAQWNLNWICAQAFSIDWNWEYDENDTEDGMAETDFCFDPRYWNPITAMQLPKLHFWALSRVLIGYNPKKKSLPRLADDFLALLEKYGPKEEGRRTLSS